MQRMLMSKYRPHGHCQRQMKPVKTETTPKTRDDKVYVVRDGNFFMYQVNEVLEGGDVLRCTELNIIDKRFNLHDTLNFGKVGVFQYLGKKTVHAELDTAEIAGKVFSYKDLLMSVSRNVLTEV